LLEVLPQARWTTEKGLGPEGLNGQIRAPSGNPIPLEKRGPRALRTMSCVSQKDVASRDMLAAMLKDLKGQEEETPLQKRASEVMVAFDGFPKAVLSNPMLRPFHEPKSVKKSTCGIVMSLYPRVGQELEDERRSRLRAIHFNMNITDAHFDALLKLVRTCFSEAGISADALQEAVAKIASLRLDVTAGYLVRSHIAEKHNSAAWRKGIMQSVKDTDIRVYANGLADLLTQDPTLHHCPVARWDVEAIHSHMQEYLSSSTSFFLPPGAFHNRVSDVDFECLSKHVLRAFQDAAFPQEAAETLHLTLLAEHQRNCINTKPLAYISGALDDGVWPQASKSLRKAMTAHPNLCYFAHQKGIPRCLHHLGKIPQKGQSINHEKLGEIHRELGLTNKHFDDFLECFGSSVGKYLGSSSMSRLMTCLAALRPFVLKSSAARQATALMDLSTKVSASETATEVSAPSSAQPPAPMTNGYPSTGSWPPKIYEALLEDAQVGSLFVPLKQQRLKEALGAFMDHTKSKQVAETATNTLAVRQNKPAMAIRNYDFDCFMESLRVCMTELRSEEACRTLGRLEVMRSFVVTEVCPFQHSSGSTVSSQPISRCPYSPCAGSACRPSFGDEDASGSGEAS